VVLGGMTAGTLISFAVYVKLLYHPISNLISTYFNLTKSLASFERVFEVCLDNAHDCVRLLLLLLRFSIYYLLLFFICLYCFAVVAISISIIIIIIFIIVIITHPQACLL